jgi:AmmeMemoRadiSam system protein B/AmmeMemoRadiSam system protein A
MKRAALFMLLILAGSVEAVTPSGDGGVRPPAAAGRFYPSDPVKLGKAIDAYINDAVDARAERPIAIVAPHAGYLYSGQIAADAFKQAAGYDYDVVVILGTNHTTGGFDGVSVYLGDGYQTPLGVAPIDRGLSERLVAMDDDFTFDPAVHRREHSVEVQVPFVQRLFPDASIVAAVVGAPDLDLCRRFGDALARVLEGRRALIVASSDLSHYPPYDDAVRVDHATLSAITRFDPDALDDVLRAPMGPVPNLRTRACGAGPILAATVAARALGATGARLVSYANSGDSSVGDHRQVVGYGAVVFAAGDQSRGQPAPSQNGAPATNGFSPDHGGSASSDGAPLGDDDKRTLLRYARSTIERFLTTETTPLLRDRGALARKQGAFVTLEEHGRLRGCIGHMAADLPLSQVVGYCALQAAFNDHRFEPLVMEELAEVDIEISLLTPLERVDTYEDIVVGRDGVLLEKDGQSAVYLPSVAVEQGWDRDEMLAHLCRKAGLPETAWRTGANFYTFRADVFSERELDEPVP